MRSKLTSSARNRVLTVGALVSLCATAALIV